MRSRSFILPRARSNSELRTSMINAASARSSVIGGFASFPFVVPPPPDFVVELDELCPGTGPLADRMSKTITTKVMRTMADETCRLIERPLITIGCPLHAAKTVNLSPAWPDCFLLLVGCTAVWTTAQDTASITLKVSEWRALC